MPSGANGYQVRQRFARVNRGSIHYGAQIRRDDHGHHIGRTSWSQTSGISLDRLLETEAEWIRQARNTTRRKGEPIDGFGHVRPVGMADGL